VDPGYAGAPVWRVVCPEVMGRAPGFSETFVLANKKPNARYKTYLAQARVTATRAPTPILGPRCTITMTNLPKLSISIVPKKQFSQR